ncbi:MAG: DegT/DnrJ/EryC1/StrS family aminotransferase, partial [Mycetocola sp.]
ILGELTDAGIGVGVHYPVPVHLTRAYADLGYEAGAFPVVEQAASAMLSLPLYPHITRDQQEYVAGTLARALKR